ncbi:hypothetical protein VUJ46_07085 [Chryseobacterium sp. MYb264]|uniref:hypothetical protein n=1 Tax=Chryseobacterium sp. MYb264 TaxID=2745153 RepID=UPI002E1196B0|nr:hypothetical protein VUJ46_07085 [Chryseobacterium sp. MYb264]
MKHILLAILMISTLSCKGQRIKIFNPKEMKTFNIQNFEKNKGKQGYVNEYHYTLIDESEVREYSTTVSPNNSELRYKREITKKHNPFKYSYTYYGNSYLYAEINEFNNSLLLAKEYDKDGRLIKETDFDKNFKHIFEQIHDIVLKEKKVDIYDTRQAVALRHDTPDATIKKYYQIHVLNSKLVGNEWYSQPDYSFIIDDATGKIIKSAENSQK